MTQSRSEIAAASLAVAAAVLLVLCWQHTSVQQQSAACALSRSHSFERTCTVVVRLVSRPDAHQLFRNHQHQSLQPVRVLR